MHDLYVKSKTDVADDAWVYGLALLATRSNRDDVPPAELKIYDGYLARVESARRSFAWKHPGVDTFAMEPDEFVKPSETEATVIAAVDAITSPNIWLDKASDANDLQGNPAIDPAVLAQSQGCVQAIHDDLDLNHALVYILNKVGAASNGITSRPPQEFNPDGEALCGGKDTYTHYKVLMSHFYQSSLKLNDYVKY